MPYYSSPGAAGLLGLIMGTLAGLACRVLAEAESDSETSEVGIGVECCRCAIMQVCSHQAHCQAAYSPVLQIALVTGYPALFHRLSSN